MYIICNNWFVSKLFISYKFAIKPNGLTLETNLSWSWTYRNFTS